MSVFVLTAGTASLLFINFCDLVYQCGCRSWWKGAADHCNIHNLQPPHCPWCTHGGISGYASFALIVTLQAVIAFWPGRFRFARRLLLAVAVFPAIGYAAACFFGWQEAYWTMLGGVSRMSSLFFSTVGP